MFQKKTMWVIIRSGVKGQKWYHRYHQSYDTKPTRSGKVGEEHFKENINKEDKNNRKYKRKDYETYGMNQYAKNDYTKNVLNKAIDYNRLAYTSKTDEEYNKWNKKYKNYIKSNEYKDVWNSMNKDDQSKFEWDMEGAVEDFAAIDKSQFDNKSRADLVDKYNKADSINKVSPLKALYDNGKAYLRGDTSVLSPETNYSKKIREKYKSSDKLETYLIEKGIKDKKLFKEYTNWVSDEKIKSAANKIKYYQDRIDNGDKFTDDELAEINGVMTGKFIFKNKKTGKYDKNVMKELRKKYKK